MEPLKALKILLGAYINDEGDVAFECKSLKEINEGVAELSIITSELEDLQAKCNKCTLEVSKICEWINTNDEMPKAGQIVFAYMENDVELGEKVFEFHDVIRAVYYPKFHMECDGTFDGDCDYDEAKDEYYWPEGWYEWNSVEDTHWMATKKAKLWMHIPVPKSSK